MNHLPITVLSNTRFPSTAAHGVYLARMCEAFAFEGMHVELVVPKRFKEVKDKPLLYYSVKMPFAVKKIWSFDFIILGRVLGKLAFILQYANFYAFVFGFFLFRSRNRVIYTMDNLGPLLVFLGYTVVFETHVGIGSYQKFLLPLLKKAHRVVVLNSIIKKDFIRAGFREENILVATNGVDLDRFMIHDSRFTKGELRVELGLSIEKKIVSYVGKYKTMGKAKGVEELVQAFGELFRERKNAHLLIVGPDEHEKQELTALLQNCGLPDDAFTLVAHVVSDEVAEYMIASDVLVMNYPDTPYYRSYMSPMKMFEYMASGNPIVASDLPSIREILNESNSVLVEPDSIRALKEGIIRLLDDSAYADRLAVQARADVSNYTWEKRARKILTFINA